MKLLRARTKRIHSPEERRDLEALQRRLLTEELVANLKLDPSFQRDRHPSAKIIRNIIDNTNWVMVPPHKQDWYCEVADIIARAVALSGKHGLFAEDIHALVGAFGIYARNVRDPWAAAIYDSPRNWQTLKGHDGEDYRVLSHPDYVQVRMFLSEGATFSIADVNALLMIMAGTGLIAWRTNRTYGLVGQR